MNVRCIINRTFLILFSLFSLSAYSQFECRSRVGRFMKPIYKDAPLLWAAEIAPAFGYINDRQMFNGQTIVALDYSKGKNQISLEGGMKYWSISDENTQPVRRIGLREGFFRHSAKNQSYTIGFQSMKLGDYFLVDERALGAYYQNNQGEWGIKIAAANVFKDWSRMGSYCNVKYIYSLLKYDVDEVIGNRVGETNFSGIVLTWTPSERKTNNSNSDEFAPAGGGEFSNVGQPADSSDGFGTPVGSEFSGKPDEAKKSVNTSSASAFSFYQAGLVAYQEFGSGFGGLRLYAGPMLTFKLPLGIDWQTELLYQRNDEYSAIGSFSKLSRTVEWNSSSSSIFEASWIGNNRIDGSKKAFGPAFSNYYMGEVLRLEAFDAPMAQLAVRHTFPGKARWFVKLKYIKQLEKWKTTAYDFETSIKVWTHIRLTALLSYVQTNMAVGPKDIILMRAEARISF